jgi:hypothetical protein
VESHGDHDVITQLLNELVSLSADPSLIFDLILIDGVHRWDIIHFIFETLSEKLTANGNLLVTMTRPMYPAEAEYPPPSTSSSVSTLSPFWFGDAWKVSSSSFCLSHLLSLLTTQAILWLRSLQNYDAAFGDFANGVVIAKKRRNVNPLPFESLLSQPNPFALLVDNL